MEKKHHAAHAETPKATGKEATDKKWMYVSYALVAILLVSVISNFFMIAKLTAYVGPPKIKVSGGGAGFVGKADAPATLIMYTDFQCPYCARWFQQTYPALKENFIDTGLVRFEVKNFPLSFHPNAMIAANAAECAEAQGSFLEYHELLYQNQGALDRSSLIRYAGEAGIDTGKFTTCLDSETYSEEISTEASDGSTKGISGTPGFLLNGQSLPLGASPYSSFESAINQVLGK